MTSVSDSKATTEYRGRSDQDSDAEPDELSNSADSCVVTSRRRQPPPARDRASQDIVRSLLCHRSFLLRDDLCCRQCWLLYFELSVAGAMSGLELGSVNPLSFFWSSACNEPCCPQVQTGSLTRFQGLDDLPCWGLHHQLQEHYRLCHLLFNSCLQGDAFHGF